MYVPDGVGTVDSVPVPLVLALARLGFGGRLPSSSGSGRFEELEPEENDSRLWEGAMSSSRCRCGCCSKEDSYIRRDS